mgnify:CR=1 FL=1
MAREVDGDLAGAAREGEVHHVGLLRGRDAPIEGFAYAACGGVPVAFGPVEGGEERKGEKQAMHDSIQRQLDHFPGFFFATAFSNVAGFQPRG